MTIPTAKRMSQTKGIRWQLEYFQQPPRKLTVRSNNCFDCIMNHSKKEKRNGSLINAPDFTVLQPNDASLQDRLAHNNPLVFFEPLTVSDNPDSKKLLSHFRGAHQLKGPFHPRLLRFQVDLILAVRLTRHKILNRANWRTSVHQTSTVVMIFLDLFQSLPPVETIEFVTVIPRM